MAPKDLKNDTKHTEILALIIIMYGYRAIVDQYKNVIQAVRYR
jgi:hypothetical protein